MGSNNRHNRIKRDILLPVVEDRRVVPYGGGMGEKYGMITTYTPWISDVIEGKSGMVSFKNSNRKRPRMDILKDIIKGFTSDVDRKRDGIVGGWGEGGNNRQYIDNNNDIWRPGCKQEKEEGQQGDYDIDDDNEEEEDDDDLIDWGSLVAAPVIPSYSIPSDWRIPCTNNNILIQVINEDKEEEEEGGNIHNTVDDWTIINSHNTASPPTTPSNNDNKHDGDFVVV